MYAFWANLPSSPPQQSRKPSALEGGFWKVSEAVPEKVGWGGEWGAGNGEASLH